MGKNLPYTGLDFTRQSRLNNSRYGWVEVETEDIYMDFFGVLKLDIKRRKFLFFISFVLGL